MTKCRKFYGRDTPLNDPTFPRVYEASILNPLHYKFLATPLVCRVHNIMDLLQREHHEILAEISSFFIQD